MDAFGLPARIPISRADAYPHNDAPDRQIKRLDVRHLLVETDVTRVGAITLAASTDNDDIDPYGIEFDLDPAAARQLMVALGAAVRRVTPRES